MTRMRVGYRLLGELLLLGVAMIAHADPAPGSPRQLSSIKRWCQRLSTHRHQTTQPQALPHRHRRQARALRQLCSKSNSLQQPRARQLLAMRSYSSRRTRTEAGGDTRYWVVAAARHR